MGSQRTLMGFQHRADAEQFLEDWKGRLRRFGLELHPDKTRLIGGVGSTGVPIATEKQMPQIVENIEDQDREWSYWRGLPCFASRGSPVRSRPRPAEFYSSPFYNLRCNCDF